MNGGTKRAPDVVTDAKAYADAAIAACDDNDGYPPGLTWENLLKTMQDLANRVTVLEGKVK